MSGVISSWKTTKSDILTSSAKIDENISHRYNKGVGTVNDIMSTLKEVLFGLHYFQTGILFRNSKLVNGILSSIESLYGMKKHHIEILENVTNPSFASSLSPEPAHRLKVSIY